MKQYINIDKDWAILWVNNMKINMPWSEIINIDLDELWISINDIYLYRYNNWKFIKDKEQVEKTKESEAIAKINVEKVKKKQEIENIASQTDQLNLMAWLLAEQILAKKEIDRTDTEKKALEIYSWIKAILINN